MLTSTRIRLTAWYVLVLALIGLVLGSVVYLTVRRALRNGVDADLRLVGHRAVNDVVGSWVVTTGANPCLSADLPLLRAQGYSVYVVDPPNSCGSLDAAARRALRLPNEAALARARRKGTDLHTIRADGVSLRLLTLPVRIGAPTPVAWVQVERPLSAEEETLDKLLTVLAVGGSIGIGLSALGGWFLAGKSLKPVHAAFARQQAFVADASHELRTPLAVIRANAEYLQLEQPESAEVSDIVDESERLSNLIDTLLLVARGDAHREQVREPVDLGAVAEQGASSLSPLARDRGVDLAVDAGGGLLVSGDRDQLRQLVVILVDNALRYTEPGGRVDVRVRESGAAATLAVTDTGIGIPAEALAHVFERFYRTDAARNRESGGAGLGLAIARKLVEDHGGRIEARSEVGRGSTFTVRLPLAGGRRPSPRALAGA